MFRKLRRQLTLVCVVGTAAVLIILSAGSLAFSISRVREQYRDAFEGNLNTIFYYLQAQSVIDQTWLARTEADSGLVIGIRVDGRDLRYTAQDPQRSYLTKLAFETAAGKHNFDLQKQPDGVAPEQVSFNLEDGKTSYRAAVATLRYGDLRLNIALLKNQSAENSVIRQTCIAFACFTAAATALLAVFAYSFTGRAIRPVRENNRRQTEFVSSASHELRTPLAVMRMGLEVLRLHPERGGEIAGKLERECAQMARLVDDLLLLARADSDRWTMRCEELSPKTIVLTAYERYEEMARGKGVEMIPALADELPATVRCDGQRIGQVLGILVDNALQYTPPGGIIRIGAATQRESLLFFVEDSGPGVAQAEVQHIFERFYRADQSRKGTENHGLGLAVAKEIVEQHKGRIAVAPAGLGGAKFTFTLPVCM